MSRHSAREKSIMFLYQIEVRDGNVHKIKEMFLSQYPIDNVDDREYFNFLVDGVIEHMKSIDDIIAKYLRGWTLDRQSLLDLAILRVAVLELLFVRLARAIPSAAEIDVLLCPVLNESYGLSSRFGKPDRPPFRRRDRNSSRRSVRIFQA
jgi:N utilization substance protein B